MIKDFLFFNYDWVFNSTYIFKSFENSGYICDFVDEKTIKSFIPEHKYKAIFLYLHEPWTIPITNHLIDNYFNDSYLIQHDDTDFEDVQIWSNKSPDLILQREYTDNTKSPYSCPIYPHHFPIQSIYRQEYQNKEYDVCFIGAPTNPRRDFFIQKIIELSKGTLKHLKWYIEYHPNRNHTEFIKNVNKTKIALNYPGNSYDAHRIWEAASAKCCIIQPQLPLKSTSDSHMPFDDYIRINMDCSDIEDKILLALKDNTYIKYANQAFESYNQYHTPKKCFEKYHEIITKHCLAIDKKIPNPL